MTGTALSGRLADLAGRSVLVATDDQLTAAISLIELDGVARRLILCPPGVAPAHLPAIVTDAEVDAIVSDRAAPEYDALDIGLRVQCFPDIRPTENTVPRSHQTEWILLTSGTSGAPKAVVHNLASLTAAIKPRDHAGPPIVWATFYDIRRYGGLQIFLRAVLGGSSLVLSDGKEPVGEFLARLRARGATHITGTPSHWRRVLWSPAAASIAPQYARMSGEVADGLRAHPVCTPSYIEEVMLPAVRAGAAKRGRSLDDFLGWAKQELRPVMRRMLALCADQDILNGLLIRVRRCLSGGASSARRPRFSGWT